MRTRVDRIEPGAGGFAVSYNGDGVEADAVVLAVPHDDAAALLPDGALPHAELGYLGASPIVNLHVVYDRPVTDLPFAAGVDTPVQWVFDRTRGTGLERGQYLAVSLSCAREYIGQKVDELRAQFVPALAQLFPEAEAATVELFFVTREQRATFRQGPGTAALRPRPAHRGRRPLPRRRVDRHRLARDDGGRGAQRRRGGARDRRAAPNA